MAAFYADEHVPTAIVDALRALGHDVLTIQDDGFSNQGVADADVLERATSLGRAVLTNNRLHFHRLHRNTQSRWRRHLHRRFRPPRGRSPHRHGRCVSCHVKRGTGARRAAESSNRKSMTFTPAGTEP